jgi:hypothetical protein
VEKGKRVALALAALLALFGLLPFLKLGLPSIFWFAQQALQGTPPENWNALPKAAGLLVHLFGAGAALRAAWRGTGLGRGLAVLAGCYALSCAVAFLFSPRR